MNQGKMHGTTLFFTLVASLRQRHCARLVCDSLRAFGGEFKDSPFWVFESDPHNVPCSGLASSGIEVLPLLIPERIKGYFLAGKVCACARAEALADPEVSSLVWLSPETMLVQPPRLFQLGSEVKAALRPVHIRNVGAALGEPLDFFWCGVYDAVGIEDVSLSVESFVDKQRLRAYFNTASIAIAPEKGLLQKWLECFGRLVSDRNFQQAACRDSRHQIFLHQAVFSALASRLGEPHIRILPPTYAYPYNLQGDIPCERQARKLNDLVHVVYEERSMDARVIADIEIDEPLKTWLYTRGVEAEA